MCKRQVFTIPKRDADCLVIRLSALLEGVDISLVERQEYPLKYGGTVLEYACRRARERAALILYLGEVTSPVGPFEGECWVEIEQSSWTFWSHKLFDTLTATLLTEGARHADLAGIPRRLRWGRDDKD
jgi:hypothetical protein